MSHVVRSGADKCQKARLVPCRSDGGARGRVSVPVHVLPRSPLCLSTFSRLCACPRSPTFSAVPVHVLRCACACPRSPLCLCLSMFSSCACACPCSPGARSPASVPVHVLRLSTFSVPVHVLHERPNTTTSMAGVSGDARWQKPGLPRTRAGVSARVAIRPPATL